MKVLFIRGAFLNRYEGQNYEHLDSDIQIIGIGSKTAIHTDFSFPVKIFFSWYDLIMWSQKRPYVGSLIARSVKVLCNRIYGDSHFLWGFEDFVRRTGPYDIAHVAETHYGYDLQCLTLQKEGHIKKIISTCWEIIPGNNESVMKKKSLKQVVRNSIDYFICPTDLAKEALIKEGVPSEKISVIRMSTDQKVSNHHGPHDRVQILFVGRLSAEKGIMELLDAFSTVAKNSKNSTLIIAGDGPLKSVIESFIRKNLLTERVTIGGVSYSKLAQLYALSDLVVIPSQTLSTIAEQYSMVAVEAMSHGKAIVATPCGALTEVLSDAAEISKDESIVSIQKSILKVLENSKYRKELEKKSRERFEKHFTIKKTRREIERIYSDVCSFSLRERKANPLPEQ